MRYLVVASLGIFPSCWASGEEQPPISLSPETRQKCLTVLRQAVDSDEFWPSIHAAEALTLAGHGEEVRRLIAPKIEAEKDDQRRCGLARELVRAGDLSKAAVLLGVLAGDNPYGHVHACESLYKVNQIGDGALLHAAMEETDHPVKAFMAAAALARHGDPQALRLLHTHLDSPDPKAARTAAWIVARIGTADDIPAVQAALDRFQAGEGRPATDDNREEEVLTRSYFEHALAALGDHAGLVALTRNLASDDPAIRTYAATFAGDARAFSTAERLVQLLDDPHIDVRVRSAQSLLLFAKEPSGPPVRR